MVLYFFLFDVFIRSGEQLREERDMQQKVQRCNRTADVAVVWRPSWPEGYRADRQQLVSIQMS